MGIDRYYKLQLWPAFCNVNCMGICSNWFWYLFVNDFKKNSFADAICVSRHVIINGDNAGYSMDRQQRRASIYFMAFPSHCFCIFLDFNTKECCTTAYNCDGMLKYVLDKLIARLDWNIHTLSK